MTENKVAVTISLSVDLEQLGDLISFLTSRNSVKVETSVNQPATRLDGMEATVGIVDEAPAEAEEPVEAEEPAEAEEPVEAEAPAEEPAEIDYGQLCDEIADRLRAMAKGGQRKEAKDYLAKYKVPALSKLNTLSEDKIVEFYNELVSQEL